MKDRIETGWEVLRLANKTLHCVPFQDIKPHRLHPKCECNPYLELDENLVEFYIHNSFDGREKFETGERKTS